MEPDRILESKSRDSRLLGAVGEIHAAPEELFQLDGTSEVLVSGFAERQQKLEKLEELEHELEIVATKLPKTVFNPFDNWSKTYRAGMIKTDFSRASKIIDVGCGPVGVNGVLATLLNPSVHAFGVDYKEEAIELAEKYISEIVDADTASRYTLIPGSSDLLQHWLPTDRYPGKESAYDGDKVDLILACIPQIADRAVKDSNVLAERGDAIAHHYAPDNYDGLQEALYKSLVKQFDALDLGLNARLLGQAREVLNPGGKVLLNLAGRVPIKFIHALGRGFGFDTRMVHQERVPQDPGTDFRQLAFDERKLSLASKISSIAGEVFEQFVFYRDEEGRDVIGAREAYELREKDQPVYHDLFVVEATLEND